MVHTYYAPAAKVKSCQNHTKCVAPSRDTVGGTLLGCLSFLAFLSFNMVLFLSLSHAQWMKSEIASLAEADLSHVFKGCLTKSFFSGSERGLLSASGQTAWICPYPLHYKHSSVGMFMTCISVSMDGEILNK